MPYRLFIACELPEAVKESLGAVQAALRPERPPVTWVVPQAMHLTLIFLGETDESLVDPVAAAMRESLAALPAPRLSLARAGTFPGVVWVGVGGEVARLRQVHAALTASLAPLGFPPEQRAYTPHLTLGRVRRDAPRADAARLARRVRALPPPDPAPWLAQRVSLFRSELRLAGPHYTALATVALLGQDS